MNYLLFMENRVDSAKFLPVPLQDSFLLLFCALVLTVK